MTAADTHNPRNICRSQFTACLNVRSSPVIKTATRGAIGRCSLSRDSSSVTLPPAACADKSTRRVTRCKMAVSAEAHWLLSARCGSSPASVPVSSVHVMLPLGETSNDTDCTADLSASSADARSASRAGGNLQRPDAARACQPSRVPHSAKLASRTRGLL